MAEAREKSEWARASALLALIANAHRDPKKGRVFRPNDFDPFAQRSREGKADITVLRDVFIEGRVPADPQEGPGKEAGA